MAEPTLSGTALTKSGSQTNPWSMHILKQLPRDVSWGRDDISHSAVWCPGGWEERSQEDCHCLVQCQPHILPLSLIFIFGAEVIIPLWKPLLQQQLGENAQVHSATAPELWTVLLLREGDSPQLGKNPTKKLVYICVDHRIVKAWKDFWDHQVQLLT